MTETAISTTRYVVLCVDDEREVLDALMRCMEFICGDSIEIEGFDSGADVLKYLETLAEQDVCVPLIVSDHAMPVLQGVDLLIEIHNTPGFRSMRKILISAQSSLQDVSRALNCGALNSNLTKPWSMEDLAICVRTQLTRFFLKQAPADLERFAGIINPEELSKAYASAEQDRRRLDTTVKALQRSFLADVDLSDERVEEAMIEGLERALGGRPRMHLQAGAVLLREGEPVETIWILISGQVQLSRRVSNRDMIFHAQTAGRIIGLLALAQQRKAFFTCRAVGDVTVIPVSIEELAEVLQSNSDLAVHFMTVLVRSLGTRSRRVADLKGRVENLARSLATERNQLTDTLDRLKKAQTRLVEAEKMATLGQLSAGIAHELNNPISAIQRSVDFLAEDLVALVTGFRDGDTIKSMMHKALTSKPLTTRELRDRGAVLLDLVKDRTLAKRLAKIGILSPEGYHRMFGDMSSEQRAERLVLMERYHELGTSLRNISSCSDRIADIVKSLRSYAKPGQEPSKNVDVHEGLEDTLRLFGHATKNVHVKRKYGDLPRIECHVGELNQVWTNLISNALQAMDHNGTLLIETESPGDDHIVVRVTDSGPGIDEENLGQIFDLHFSTKEGRIQFGLGMGLPICHQIVTRHGGMISVESQPGRTCFAVVFPVRQAAGNAPASDEGLVS